MVLREIEELRRIAFDVDPNINSVRKSQNAAEDYKKLGFEVTLQVLDIAICLLPDLQITRLLYFCSSSITLLSCINLESATDNNLQEEERADYFFCILILLEVFQLFSY